MTVMTSPAVRPESPSDAEAVRFLVGAAFGQPHEAILLDALRRGAHLHASSVALLDEAIVAHASLSRGTIKYTTVLILAPVSVHPDFQSRGLGTAVVKHVLGTSDRAVVVLGDPGYYRRFGFVAATDHGITDPTFDPPAGVLQVLRPERAPSGPVEYPAPFLDP
jgi:putative acetyltransferase